MRGALGAAIWIAAVLVVAGSGGLPPRPATPDARVRAQALNAPAQFNGLPRATTFARLTGLPDDPSPFAVTNGEVVHPLTQQPVYGAPGGRPIAVLPATELGDPTWVPVIQTRPGWERVLLPSRPNHLTGWLSVEGAAARNFVVRYSSYLIQVDVGTQRLTVSEDGHSLGSWTVAVGAIATPTPIGRTFLLADVKPPGPIYSPLILPLGTHSNILDSFGGGPGTVALHGWPDPAVFGHQVSHGCVRVPAQALHVLSQIPLGTLVLIGRIEGRR